jgi:hypothetical protein
MPFARALALTRVDPVAAAAAIREAVRTTSPRMITSQGGGERFPTLLAAAGVAGLAGNAGAVDTVMRLAQTLLTVPADAPVRLDPALMVGWIGASVKVAMGVPIAAVRKELDDGLAFVDRAGNVAGVRNQNWSAPYVLFLATRDPRYAAMVRRRRRCTRWTRWRRSPRATRRGRGRAWPASRQSTRCSPRTRR